MLLLHPKVISNLQILRTRYVYTNVVTISNLCYIVFIALAPIPIVTLTNVYNLFFAYNGKNIIVIYFIYLLIILICCFEL